jgi:hypothetical protein
MRRFATLTAVVLLWGSVLSAERLSTRDIIGLSQAGLGDEVLLALIDVRRAVYPIDPATLTQLKDGGVSERVIAALVRSGREPLPAEPPPAVGSSADNAQPQPHPQVVVIEHAAPEIREVAVPVPVYVAVGTPRGRVHRSAVITAPAAPDTRFVPFQQGPPTVWPTAETPKEPVYWGWGGKRRPDTWDAPPQRRRGSDHK